MTCHPSAGGPVDLVRRALLTGEVEQLLVGSPPYAIRHRSSSSTTATDLPLLFDQGIYPLASDLGARPLRDSIMVSIPKLTATNPGTLALAFVVLIEAMRRARGAFSLELDLSVVALALRSAIEKRWEALASDSSLGGGAWPDGLLGELRRIALNSARFGAPRFFPDDELEARPEKAGDR